MKRIFQEVALHVIAIGLVTAVMATMVVAVVLECEATDRQWDRMVSQ